MGTKVKEIFKYKGKHILYNTGQVEQEEEKEEKAKAKEDSGLTEEQMSVVKGSMSDNRISDSVKDLVEKASAEPELSEDGVSLERYDALQDFLSESGGMSIFVDKATLNHQLFQTMEQAGVTPVFGTTPVALAKAVKNPFEIEGMKSAHIRDGVAMVRFLHWLEKSVQAERRVSEWDAAVKLGEFRSEVSGYQGDSFETISAYGPGAALPHYVTPRGDAPLLEAHGLYLCDSGGQYLDGTTDITRTVPLGDLTPLEREDYTLVLKGHIDLAMALFPEGTPGCRIDALAREPLWRFKRNFGHGTGHGVGSFLGVHEGPQDVRHNLNPQPLVSGMVISDEPGIYREGQHGVRHESVLLCRESGSNEFGDWLEWENLTLCHIDTGAIIRNLMTEEEINWLNAYNAKVYDSLKDHLPAEVAQWLQEKTRPI